MANAGTKGNDGCFQCGEVGHYAHNCPQHQRNRTCANLINFDLKEETFYKENMASGTRVSHIHNELDAFDEERSQRLPKHTIWDHAIELLPNALATLPARLLPLNQKVQEKMQKFVEEHLKCGTIQES
jgi:hypothetical protein